ncbi:MAG: hypothetical protein D6814_10385 [Calditrichaeota bacterium]|nr:MAG: hypothetical protein D6814_10385 [Calditrichota bacterium]
MAPKAPASLPGREKDCRAIREAAQNCSPASLSGRKQRLEHVQFVHLGVDPQEEVGWGHRFSQRIFRLPRAEPAGGRLTWIFI